MDTAEIRALIAGLPQDDPELVGLQQLLAARAAIERREAHREDIQAFCNDRLVVRTKVGEHSPLRLNTVQLKVHALLEEQKRKTGMVRALILKARRMGISTYVGARFYKHSVYEQGKQTFILTHEMNASDALFRMVTLFYEHDPEKPRAGAHSAKELWFDELNNRYEVATAGTKETGRGSTAQYGHLSEFAFYDNAESQMAAIGQTISSVRGTEIIVESTANGMGNLFYSMWQDAVRGTNDYLPIFLPWFEDPDNQRVPPDGFELTREELKYQETYGLSLAQMAWRRSKIASDFSRNPELFKQEFPANPTEAFTASVSGALIEAETVVAAQKRKPSRRGRLRLGVDSAGDSEVADRTAFVLRDDAAVHMVKTEKKLNTMGIVGRTVEIVRAFPQITDICVDTIGLGKGVYDRLMELDDMRHRARSVKVSMRAIDHENFANLRAELAVAVREWLQGDAAIPDNPELFTDLTALRLEAPDSKGRLVLESKDDAKKRGVRSPDTFDALACTFYGEMVEGFAAKGGWKAWTEKDAPPCDLIFRSAAIEFDELGGQWAVTKWGVFMPKEAKDSAAILLDCSVGSGSLGDFLRAERQAFGWVDEKGRPAHDNKRVVDFLLVPRAKRRDDVYRQLFKANLSPRRIRYDSTVGPQVTGDLIARGRVWIPERRWALQVQSDVQRYPQGERPLVAHSVAMALTYLRNMGQVAEDDDAETDVQRSDFRAPYG